MAEERIPVTVKRTGILYVRNDKGRRIPEYVIDLINRPYGDPYYVVYKTKASGSSRLPVKDYKEVEIAEKAELFEGNSVLANLARQVTEARKEKAKRDGDVKGKPKRRVTKPPLYIAYQEKGVDTFSGKPAIGFKERTKDTQIGNHFEQGTPTGVFISEDIIQWEKPTINLGELADNAGL